MNILLELQNRFHPALPVMTPAHAEMEMLLPVIRPAQDTNFGDYQANFAMSLAKQLGKSPRDVAADVIQRVDVADLCHPPEVAGPGFINLRLRDEWMSARLVTALRDERLGVPQAA